MSVRIKIKECEYNIIATGQSMEELFGLPREMTTKIKQIAKKTRSFRQTMKVLLRSEDYLAAFVLLIAIWNEIPLTKGSRPLRARRSDEED
jgi:hypothetical protein